MSTYSVVELQARSNIVDGYNLPANSSFSSKSPALNDSGTIAFTLNVVGGGNAGLWTGAGGAGSVVYDAPANRGLEDPSIDDGGSCAFDQSDIFSDGIYVYDAGSGMTAQEGRTGDLLAGNACRPDRQRLYRLPCRAVRRCAVVASVERPVRVGLRLRDRRDRLPVRALDQRGRTDGRQGAAGEHRGQLPRRDPPLLGSRQLPDAGRGRRLRSGLALHRLRQRGGHRRRRIGRLHRQPGGRRPRRVPHRRRDDDDDRHRRRPRRRLDLLLPPGGQRRRASSLSAAPTGPGSTRSSSGTASSCCA